MDSVVWNGSNTLLSEGKAIGKMIFWIPSIPTVYENGFGYAGTHAGNLAKDAFTIKTSPLLMPRMLEEVLRKMSCWRVA